MRFSVDWLLTSTLVIKRIVEYAHRQKERNESMAFFDVCTIAVRLSTDALEQLEPPAGDYASIRESIQGLMDDLERHLSRTPATAPSPSLMIALLDYIGQNPDVQETFRGLIDALRPTIGSGPHASTLHARGHATEEMKRARDQLRRLFSPKPKRRNAALPAIELGEMDLQLPMSPVPGSSGQSRQ